ncbi:MAG: hypothetical protein JNK05_30150 [Myxococcales bacterium]|nr:hypothetical protein [Myxococcales bacterium]
MDVEHADASMSETDAADAARADVMSGPCYFGDAAVRSGEMYWDGCNFCFCNVGGVFANACWSRACTTDSGMIESEFRSTDAGACAPEARTLGQPNEAEVRYPCGIPGAPVRPRDPRCASLCAPGFARMDDSVWCNLSRDPNTVLCWGM